MADDWQAMDFFRGDELVTDPYPYFDALRGQCPVMYPASSETRNAQAAAISSGRPIRRTGVCSMCLATGPPSRPRSSARRSMGVSMKPGVLRWR